jgi:hypothetical protein
LNISKTYAIIQKIEFVTAEIENTKMSAYPQGILPMRHDKSYTGKSPPPGNICP